MNTDSLRVLFLGLNYEPETTGVAPYASALCRGLAKRGHQVRALVANPHYPEWRLRPGYKKWHSADHIDGVAVTRLLHAVPRRPRPLARAGSEISLGLRHAMTRWGRPSVVLAVSPGLLTTAISRLRAALTHPRVPFVIWVQDLYGAGLEETGQANRVVTKLVRAIEGTLLRSATHVVVIHDRFANRVAADHGIASERISVIRNWTHLPRFEKSDIASVRRAHGWGNDDFVVLHSGNMGVKQGLHNVVEAAALADACGERIKFVLVGDGSQRTELLRLAEEKKCSIQFIPTLTTAEYLRTLQAADLLLVNELPGVAEMAVPSKLTSYFAAARPILAATDSSGITAHEVRSAGAGVIVRPGDPAAILRGVLQVAADPANAESLGANGRQFMEGALSETYAIDRFAILLSAL